MFLVFRCFGVYLVIILTVSGLESWAVIKIVSTVTSICMIFAAWCVANDVNSKQ